MGTEELKRRAKESLHKRAEYGEDIDIEEYDFGELERIEPRPLTELSKPLLDKARSVGVDVEEREASGTFFQVDHRVVREYVAEFLRRQGVVVMSTSEAVERFDWAKEYYWRAVSVDTDKYTAAVGLYERHGYFIYVPPGVKVSKPVQACLLMVCENVAQPVHNIVIVDEGAELNLTTSCAVVGQRGLHIGVSEFYVKRNAKLTFTMIHGWSPGVHVRPRTGVIVEEGGVFSNYYVNLHEVKSLQSYPKVVAKRGASVYLTSIVIGLGRSKMDLGGGIWLRGEESRGEIVSRSIIKDSASVVMRGKIAGEASNVRGHLECRGLLLSKSARGEAVPILESRSDKAELTHEAALGRISEEEILYLMAKGFTEEEAVSIIVRGFVEAGLEYVPKQLRPAVEGALEMIARLAKG